MSLALELDERWIEVKSKKRKTKTGQVLEKTRGSKSGAKGPSLELLKSRLNQLDKKVDSGKFPPLGEGRLSDVHLAVSQLLYVKSDAARALPLLEELESGLERGRVERNKERQKSLTEEHKLGPAYDALQMGASGAFPEGLQSQLGGLQGAKAEFEEEPSKSGALKLNAALEEFSEQAKTFCEKWKQENGGPLESILSEKDIKKQLKPLQDQVKQTASTFEENMSGGDYLSAAAGCKTLDELIGNFTTRRELNETQGLDPAYAAFELTKNRYFADDLQPPIATLAEAKETFESAPTEELAGKFKAARDIFADQAKVSCEKWKQENDRSLQAVLSQKDVKKQMQGLHQELIKTSDAFDKSLAGKDYITAAADCKDVDGLMRGFAARDKFDELSEPIGEGIWKINSTQIYQPSGPIEVPNTSFNAVCPGQDHVNRQIVEAKLSGKLPANPVVPVVVAKDGTLVLQDKHHTFVACMALGRPVKLALTSNPLSKAKKSWNECTWKGFEKPGAAGAGFSVPKDKSAALEGEAAATPGWEKIVPWRKDVPESDQGKVDALVEGFQGVTDSKAVNQELAAACQDDPGLAKKLYEVLKIGAVSVKVRKKPEKSTGGDWDAEENTVYVDDDLKPLDMVDMLIWEAHNAIHQIDFSKARHEAYRDRKGPDEVGQDLAKIEAKTEIEYLEHLLARSGKGSEISGNGQKHLDGIDKKFVEKGLKPYSKMSEEERELHHKDIEQIFIETPHDATKKLPDRAALKSSEVYAYEHVADTQNVKGVTGYFRDKIPDENPKKGAFVLALRDIKDSPAVDPKQPPKSWAGLFYDMVSQSANAIFGLGVPEFSAEQKQVAKEEASASGAPWVETLKKALDQVATMEVKVEAPKEAPVGEQSPAAQLYDQHRARLGQSSVMGARTNERDSWALARGVRAADVNLVTDAINTALAEALEVFKTQPPTDEEFEQANKILEGGIKELEVFEKKLREVKAKSREEADFREQLGLIEKVPLLSLNVAGVKEWAQRGGYVLRQANAIQRTLEDALTAAYKALGTAPASAEYENASRPIKTALGKYAEFLKK